MAWIAALGAVAASAMSDKGGSSGGTTTQSRDPWGPAAPWLTQNLDLGQRLQGHYQANPFNQQQQNAYGNLSAQTAYANQIIPQLIAQLSGQGGFDRTKPLGRPAPMMFPAMPAFGANPVNMNVANNPFANGLLPAPSPAPAPAPMPQLPMPFYGGDGL